MPRYSFTKVMAEHPLRLFTRPRTPCVWPTHCSFSLLIKKMLGKYTAHPLAIIRIYEKMILTYSLNSISINCLCNMEPTNSLGLDIWTSINCVCNMEHDSGRICASSDSINCVCNMELPQSNNRSRHGSINCLCNMELKLNYGSKSFLSINCLCNMEQ